MIQDPQEYLQQWEKENNPFYPDEMRWDRVKVNIFLKDWKQQCNELQGEIYQCTKSYKLRIEQYDMDTLNDIIAGLKWGNLDPIEAHERVLRLFQALRKTAVSRWVSVKDELPKEDGTFLTFTKNKVSESIGFTLFVDGQFMSSFVTHWAIVEKPIENCDKPCSHSDWYKGGKCDKNGCYYE